MTNHASETERRWRLSFLKWIVRLEKSRIIELSSKRDRNIFKSRLGTLKEFIIIESRKNRAPHFRPIAQLRSRLRSDPAFIVRIRHERADRQKFRSVRSRVSEATKSSHGSSGFDGTTVSSCRLRVILAPAPARRIFRSFHFLVTNPATGLPAKGALASAAFCAYPGMHRTDSTWVNVVEV